MTNEEALRHLTGEQIDTLVTHYEIPLPKKSKVSRGEKEAAVLKFAEEKEMDLSDLIEEDEAKTGQEEAKAGAEEQQDKKNEGAEPEANPTPAAEKEDKKPAKKGAKTTLPALSTEESEEEQAPAEDGRIEVTFIENAKFSGTRYQKNDKVVVDKNTADYLIAQKLAIVASGKKIVYTVCEQCKRTIE